MENFFKEVAAYMFVVIAVIAALLLSVTLCYNNSSDFYCWTNHHKLYDVYVGDFVAEHLTTDGEMVAEYVDEHNDIHIFVPLNSIQADMVYVTEYCPVCDCEVKEQPNVACVLLILCMLIAEITGFTACSGIRFLLHSRSAVRSMKRSAA